MLSTAGHPEGGRYNRYFAAEITHHRPDGKTRNSRREYNQKETSLCAEGYVLKAVVLVADSRRSYVG